MGRRRCRCAQKALTFNSEFLAEKVFFFFLCTCLFPVLAAVSINPAGVVGSSL